MHASGLTALVGREEEFALLLRRWSQAKTGEGQVVLLSGEAGIGKSRLTAALLESVAAEPHTRLRYFCSPQHTDSAHYPIIGQRNAPPDWLTTPPQTKLDKLDAVLRRVDHTQERALCRDAFSPMMDATPRSTTPQRRQNTGGAYAQIEAVTRSVHDDLRGCALDEEEVGRTADWIAKLHALLIVTFRPAVEAPWIERPQVTALTINRLAQREIDVLIDRVAGNNPLPANIRQDIVERNDGIPLFVEEMTKAVPEADGEGGARRTAAAIPSPALSVPPSLHASLMARLDRLGPARELAQIGAAIGREFSHSLLASVASKREAKLATALDSLIAAGLLFRQGTPPHSTYLFKHALVQDAAYGTLLRETRRALHTRIAEALESQFAEIAESQPELLARHFTEAGLIEKAALLWGKAGQRSEACSAFFEAVEQLTRALAQIAALSATPTLRQEEIKLQVALITPLSHTKGTAAPETKAASERARLLIERAEAMGEPVNDPLLLFSVLNGSWSANWAAFDGEAMCALAAQFLALAEKQSATGPLRAGHFQMGISLMATGDARESLTHFDQAIALYDPTKHRPPTARYDGSVLALLGRAWTLWFLGYPAAALGDAESALGVAREIGQVATLVYALGHDPKVQIPCGNGADAAARAQEQAALAEEKGAPFWKPFGMMNQGCALFLTGPPSKAIELLVAGIAMAGSAGSTMWLPFHFLHLARAHADLGQFDEAWRYIDNAMTAVETTKERCWEAEVDRTAGEIALLSKEPDAAKSEAWFERARCSA